MTLFEPVFRALDQAGVRYVVVGGVAVVLHGHARLTADLDLAVDLNPEPARTAIEALVGLGLRPTVPVDPAMFADAETRDRWVSERNMRVFSMRHLDDPLNQVDLFVDEPIPFEELWGRSIEVALENLRVRIASIPDLITMKELAGRRLDEGGHRRATTDPRGGISMKRASDRVADEDDAREARQRERIRVVLAGTTPAERLAWLEAAIAFAARAGALPRPDPSPRG